MLATVPRAPVTGEVRPRKNACPEIQAFIETDWTILRLLKRLLPITAGIATFAAIMLLTGPVMLAISYAFHRTTSFPGGQPPDRFIVALRDAAAPVAEAAITTARWGHFATLKTSGAKFTFLLPGKGGKIPGPSGSNHIDYKVIEDRGASQIIEVSYVNTHSSWSRYEAFGNRIVPISYRTDGGILSGIVVLPLLIAGGFFGQVVTYILRKKLAAA